MFIARTLLITLLSVQFSFCPTPPRMVRSFRYNMSQIKAMETSKKVLENLGYNIDLYTKESFFITTKSSPIKKDLRRYDYALAVIVQDHVQVFIIAEKYIFKRGSDVSIGGSKEITEVDAVDWLPYSIQQKIFWPLIDEFSKYGLKEIQNFSYLQNPKRKTKNA